MAAAIVTSAAPARQARRIVNWRRSDSVKGLLEQSDGPELERALWVIAGRLQQLGGGAIDMAHIRVSGLVDEEDRAGFQMIVDAIAPLAQEPAAAAATAWLAAELDWMQAHYPDETELSDEKVKSILDRIEGLPLTPENTRLRARACGVMVDFDPDELMNDAGCAWDRLAGQVLIAQWNA